jgi:hypothetical protein
VGIYRNETGILHELSAVTQVCSPFCGPTQLCCRWENE